MLGTCGPRLLSGSWDTEVPEPPKAFLPWKRLESCAGGEDPKETEREATSGPLKGCRSTNSQPQDP